jgi:hypothetical protein
LKGASLFGSTPMVVKNQSQMKKKEKKKRSPRCQLKDISLSREKCSQKPQILSLKNHPKLKASPQLNH